MLARALVSLGHAVRGTTRNPGRREAIEAAGAQCVVADPDRVGSLIPALDHASVAVILLGSACGEPAELAQLHGPRLEMLASRMVDTTIRGVIYEAHGDVDPALLATGAQHVRDFGARSRAQVALLRADPGEPQQWLDEALAAVEAILGER